MSQVLIFFIRVYQLLISPVIHTATGPTFGCRYNVSCSEYAINALKTEGIFRGTARSINRIIRCV